MSSALSQLLDFVWIPILLAQWVGVIVLRKTGRTPAWWGMFIGAILTSLALIAQFLVIPIVTNAYGQRGYADFYSEVRFVAAKLMALGFLSFFVGFTIHSMRIASLTYRIFELETMNLIQARELERLRNR